MYNFSPFFSLKKKNPIHFHLKTTLIYFPPHVQFTRLKIGPGKFTSWMHKLRRSRGIMWRVHAPEQLIKFEVTCNSSLNWKPRPSPSLNRPCLRQSYTCSRCPYRRTECRLTCAQTFQRGGHRSKTSICYVQGGCQLYLILFQPKWPLIVNCIKSSLFVIDECH